MPLYSSYHCCLWCGAILDIYLDFHNCLLYLDIADLNGKVNAETSRCYVIGCSAKLDSIRDYVSHMMGVHSCVLVFKCTLCSVGFINPSSVKYHQWNFCEALHPFV